MLIYDKQFENKSDLNDDYKILSYFHKHSTIVSAIFKDQGEGNGHVRFPNIWYLWKALSVLLTGHHVV